MSLSRCAVAMAVDETGSIDFDAVQRIDLNQEGIYFRGLFAIRINFRSLG